MTGIRTGALLALSSLLVALAGGCRGGLGTVCRCAADCRSGLVCGAEGENALTAELCYKPGVSGLCIESEDIEDSGVPVELTEAPEYLDMASKRDFQPSGSISDSVTGTGTTVDTTTGTTMTSMTSMTGTTDATTGTTVDTTTGTTDATGTSSTGTTTVDTTTGTGTTAGSSSTSTSTSSSSSGSSSSGSTGTT